MPDACEDFNAYDHNALLPVARGLKCETAELNGEILNKNSKMPQHIKFKHKTPGDADFGNNNVLVNGGIKLTKDGDNLDAAPIFATEWDGGGASAHDMTRTGGPVMYYRKWSKERRKKSPTQL